VKTTSKFPGRASAAGRNGVKSAKKPGRAPKIMNLSDKKTGMEKSTNNELVVRDAKTDKDGLESAGNVDKIRDILFGSQMRDYEKKFVGFEGRLAAESAELRDEVKRRFASLEAFIKSEITALGDQLKSEKGERVEADKELAREQKEAARALERKTAQIEEQMTKSLRDLRENVLEESKRLTEEMERRHKALALTIDKEVQELRGSLTDRLALADLFAEVALRLKNEFKLPAKK
jgi:paraquat-inducible protein B